MKQRHAAPITRLIPVNNCFVLFFAVGIFGLTAHPARAVVLLPGDLIVAIQNAHSGTGEIDLVNPTTGQQTLIATDTTSQTMSAPYDAVLGQDGMIYTADGGTRHILSILPATGAISVVTTFPSGSFFGNLALNSNGDLLVADQGLHGIYKVNPTNGSSVKMASIAAPYGIALDRAGNIFASDIFANAIFKVDASSGQVSTISVGGLLNIPRGLAVDDNGYLDVVNQENGLVRVNPTNGSQVLLSSGGFLADALGLTIEANGTILIAESGSAINPTGAILAINPTNGNQSILSSGGRFLNESGVAVVPEPGTLIGFVIGSLLFIRPRKRKS